MTPKDIIFRDSTTTAPEVSAHLWACDEAFDPKLSDRLDIETYAEKIVQNAVTFEAWDEGRLVGLVAAYINDPERQNSYVTHVCVVPDLAGQGIAATLIEACLAKARRDRFAEMTLEVGRENLRAIGLYEKFGFRVQDDKDGILKMGLKLFDPQPTALTGGTR